MRFLQDCIHVGTEDRLRNDEIVVVIASAADVFIEPADGEKALTERILEDGRAEVSVAEKLTRIFKEVRRDDLRLPVVLENVPADAVGDGGGDVDPVGSGWIREDIVDLFFCEDLGIPVFIDPDLGEGVSGEILKSVHLAFVDGVGKAAC